jgi:hypothetical protein
MDGMAFRRQREDFTCVACGTFNRGDGYTNHCAHCLTSLHVDVDPGDRAHRCHGVMPPIAVESTGGRYVVVHRCRRCGVVKRCKAGPRDSSDAMAEVMRRAAEAAVREARAWEA